MNCPICNVMLSAGDRTLGSCPDGHRLPAEPWQQPASPSRYIEIEIIGLPDAVEPEPLVHAVMQGISQRLGPHMVTRGLPTLIVREVRSPGDLTDRVFYSISGRGF